MSVNKENHNNTLTPTVGRYGGALCENGGEARKVSSFHTPDLLDERLLMFLPAYRASTHGTTGMMPVNMMFGRELRLPCDLLFATYPHKEGSTTGRLKAPLGSSNVLVEPSSKTSGEGLYIARIIVRYRPGVLVNIMNVTKQDQVLSEVHHRTR
jgi:hypothetical protein